MNAQTHCRRLEEMKLRRLGFESHWQEVLDYNVPRKADVISSSFEGNKRNLHLFDSTAEHCCEQLAGALHSMLTNPSSIWFELTTGDVTLDADDEVRVWLKDTSERMYSVIRNSNFNTEIHEIYIDLVSIGTACLSMEEDKEEIIRFASRFMGQIYVSENNLGIIDTVYRCFQYTARQANQEWPDNKEIEDIYKKTPEKKIDIIHCVYPNAERKSGKKNKINKPYASVYIWKEKKIELSFSGFDVWPYATPRWTKATGEIYGRSPGMKTLPDTKMINEMMKTIISAAQKAVDPPLILDDEGVLLPIDTTPGGLNYRRAGSQGNIEPLKNGSQIDLGYQVMEDVRKRIRDGYYNSNLNLVQGPQQTATEVLQRTDENMRVIGPVLGRQEPELLRPVINKVFDIMWRRKLIAEPPAQLQGRKIEAHYTSIIAKAQRSQEAQNIMRVLQAVQPFAQSDPSIMDNLNGDEALRFTSSLYGMPTRILRSKREVEQIRSRREQAQAEMQKQNSMSQGMDNLNKAAPVLSLAARQINGENI